MYEAKAIVKNKCMSRKIMKVTGGRSILNCGCELNSECPGWYTDGKV
jgi:hypothetical protein